MAQTTCSPMVAAGGLADLGFQEEVCFGQFPDAPALRTFRRRSTTLALTKDAFQSEEVRSDRMTSDSRHGVRRANGDITSEISPGSHADAWQAVLGGEWQGVAAMTFDGAGNTLTVSQGPAPDTFTLTFAGNVPSTAGYRPGDTVTIAGTGTDFDGWNITITDLDTGALVGEAAKPPGFDVTLPVTFNAGTMTLKGARCAMGNIFRSFIFERAFSDIGSFLTYRGLIFNTTAVDLPATGIATSTFGLVGKTADPISGASFDGVAELTITDDDLGALTFNAAAGTITAATGNFATEGVTEGDKVIFEGAGFDGMPQNRNPRTVMEVDGATIRVAEAIQSGVTAGDYTVTRVGLPDYADAPTSSVLVAVSGALLINGEPVATVTAASFNIDNQIAGSEVVGSNVIPVQRFGLQSAMSGSMTVLFDRGGTGALLYNAFDTEDEISLQIRLDSDDAEDFMTFYFPRVKVNSGTIGDAVAEGLPVAVEWTALKPGTGSPVQSQIVVQDSTVTAPTL